MDSFSSSDRRNKPTDFAVTRGVRITTMTKLNNFLKDESGATIIEYGLLAALLSIAAISILPSLGGRILALFTTVDTALT